MTKRATGLLDEIVSKNIKLTPMMEQYYEIRKDHPDTMLLFRMGDFYEVFFEDAFEASKILNIAKTHRGKLGDYPIPMAGIPHHAASNYIDRLTQEGLRVAICEQVEDPKEAKGIVKRAVTQVVSPGMPYDLDKAKKIDQHFMLSFIKGEAFYYLVALDFTTGDFFGVTCPSYPELLDEIKRLSPREWLTFPEQWIENGETECEEDKNKRELSKLLSEFKCRRTSLSEMYFDPKKTHSFLEKIIPGHKRDKVLMAYPDILSPLGALSYYITTTQKIDELIHLRPFKMLNRSDYLKLNFETLRGLEILPRYSNTSSRGVNSVLEFMDQTKTSMGSRKLKEAFLNPLLSPEKIIARQGCIDFLLKKNLEEIRKELSEVRDIDRILSKLSTAKANAGDLLNLASAITIYNNLSKVLAELDLGGEVHPLSKDKKKALDQLSLEIQETLNDEIGASLDKGNLIRPGASKERDRLAKLSCHTEEELKKLEAKYQEETGIPKLRVKANNLNGYFIEVTKTHSEGLPAHFIRRQTLVNTERFMTEELREFEKEIYSAKHRLEKLEREIFKGLLTKVSSLSEELKILSSHYAFIDFFQSLAWVAKEEGFSRPHLSNVQKFSAKGMWHPLIKSQLREEFVPHSLSLHEEKFFGLITGPNMAGKTTVMREVAIIQHLTQIGSYVPAKKAELSLCDHIFSRLGASDDILRGQSTFMVEMSETAEILRHATKNSLIILDEVGRGTSTYDGLSIAWALVEHLIEKTKATTLFATHYHELIDLMERYPQGVNLTVKTKNEGDIVHFLYQLIEEPAPQSFGIYVAKLAGLPKSLLKRSGEILHDLEQKNTAPSHRNKEKKTTAQLSLFEETQYKKQKDNLKLKLEKIDINNLTPLKALEKLNELKNESRLH